MSGIVGLRLLWMCCRYSRCNQPPKRTAVVQPAGGSRSGNVVQPCGSRCHHCVFLLLRRVTVPYIMCTFFAFTGMQKWSTLLCQLVADLSLFACNMVSSGLALGSSSTCDWCSACLPAVARKHRPVIRHWCVTFEVMQTEWPQHIRRSYVQATGAAAIRKFLQLFIVSKLASFFVWISIHVMRYRPLHDPHPATIVREDADRESSLVFPANLCGANYGDLVSSGSDKKPRQCQPCSFLFDTKILSH